MGLLTTADLEAQTLTAGEGWALAHVRRILRLVEDISADLTYDAHAFTVAAYLHDWGASTLRPAYCGACVAFAPGGRS